MLSNERSRERAIREFRRDYVPASARRMADGVVRAIVTALAVLGGLGVLAAVLDALM